MPSPCFPPTPSLAMKTKHEATFKGMYSMEEAEGRKMCPMLDIRANIGTCSKVINISLNPWVFMMGKVRDIVEVAGGDH